MSVKTIMVCEKCEDKGAKWYWLRGKTYLVCSECAKKIKNHRRCDIPSLPTDDKEHKL